MKEVKFEINGKKFKSIFIKENVRTIDLHGGCAGCYFYNDDERAADCNDNDDVPLDCLTADIIYVEDKE